MRHHGQKNRIQAQNRREREMNRIVVDTDLERLRYAILRRAVIDYVLGRQGKFKTVKSPNYPTPYEYLTARQTLDDEMPEFFKKLEESTIVDLQHICCKITRIDV